MLFVKVLVKNLGFVVGGERALAGVMAIVTARHAKDGRVGNHVRQCFRAIAKNQQAQDNFRIIQVIALARCGEKT